MSDVSEAAERVRKWKTGEFDYAAEDSHPMEFLNDDRRILADAYLASLHADDEELADVMWLAQNFDEVGNLRNQRQFVVRHPVCVFALACQGPKCWRIELWCGDQNVKDDPTRGEISSLARLLGIPIPKEPTDGE